MKEKCCRSCLFFGEFHRLDRKPDKYYTRPTYHCQLHGFEASITHPESQFCGDEHWISVKVKTRLDNLDKLDV